MMRVANWKMILMLALIPLLTAFAQSDSKPYAGQEKREIKSLSPDEIKAYLEGQGMGYAKAAELNSYPGPRHVLDMADALQLSVSQRAETQRIFDAMHREAVSLGRRIVEREGELNALFARKEIDADKLRAATRDIALLQGDLRAVHLRAHLEMKRTLSPAQIKKYDELRGYNSAPAEHDMRKHHGKH